MQKYEYKTTVSHYEFEEGFFDGTTIIEQKELDGHMNGMGEEGWEIVSLHCQEGVQQLLCHWKRPKE